MLRFAGALKPVPFHNQSFPQPVKRVVFAIVYGSTKVVRILLIASEEKRFGPLFHYSVVYRISSVRMR